MKNMIARELGLIRESGGYRSMRSVSSPQGREIVLEGRKVLNFCSNDYLGLAGDVRLAQAAGDAFGRFGFGSGASRLVCGNTDEHALLEREVAAFKGTEAAIVFSSGYMANVGVIPALCGRSDTVFSDRLNHASIIDGIILSRACLKRYGHRDMTMLEKMMETVGTKGRRLVVSDTVFSMDGDIAPLRELSELARRYGAWFMVDEAHAFGLFGKTGAGLVQEFGLEGQVEVQMGTLSKSVGVFGAYIAGSRELVDFLINRSRSFIYSTGMPAAVAAAARAGLRIMRDEPERRGRVLALASRLREGLRQSGFDILQSTTPVIPVMIGDVRRAVDFSAALLERGILVAAIRPPTVPVGLSRLRITVTASHVEEDLARCVAAMVQVRDKLL